MRTIAENIYRCMKSALFFAAMPFLSALLLWSEKKELSKQKGNVGRAWLSFCARVWDRAGDLADTSRVDVAVLFSSFVLSTWFIILLFDRHYLERYPTLLYFRTYGGGYWFWFIATGAVSFLQFVAAFAYGMKGVNTRAWERACILTTAVAAGLYIIMHGLIMQGAHGETPNSCMYLGLFVLNLSFAVRFGFRKAVARSAEELAEVFEARAGIRGATRPTAPDASVRV